MYFTLTILSAVFALEIMFYKNITIVNQFKADHEVELYKSFESYAKAEIDNVLDNCNGENIYSIDFKDSKIDFDTYCSINNDTGKKEFEVKATYKNFSKTFNGEEV
jgi:hypothetical protein